MLHLLSNAIVVVGVVAPSPYSEDAPCSYGEPADLEYYNHDSPPSYYGMCTNGGMFSFNIFNICIFLLLNLTFIMLIYCCV